MEARWVLKSLGLKPEAPSPLPFLFSAPEISTPRTAPNEACRTLYTDDEIRH